MTKEQLIDEFKVRALRIIDDYDFVCEAGMLTDCRDFQRMILCAVELFDIIDPNNLKRILPTIEELDK